VILVAHPALAYLEMGQRPTAGDSVPGPLGFPALDQKHDERSRSVFHEDRHRRPVCPPTWRPLWLVSFRGPRSQVFSMRRRGPGTWATLLLWDVAFLHAMFLAQSDRSPVTGDESLPQNSG